MPFTKLIPKLRDESFGLKNPTRNFSGKKQVLLRVRQLPLETHRRASLQKKFHFSARCWCLCLSLYCHQRQKPSPTLQCNCVLVTRPTHNGNNEKINTQRKQGQDQHTAAYPRDCSPDPPTAIILNLRHSCPKLPHLPS